MHNLIYFLFFIPVFFIQIISSKDLVSNEAIVIEQGTKLRACQGLSCNVLKIMQRGKVVKVLAEYHMVEIGNYGLHPWYRVEVDSVKGYLFGGLIKSKNTLKVPKVVSGYLLKDANVRNCASVSCKDIGFLPNGSYLERIKNRKNGWYKVVFRDKSNAKVEGYIYHKLIKESPNYLIVNFPKKNLYDRPDGVVTRQLSRGKRLKVLSKKKLSKVVRPYGRYFWYKVKSGKTTGWMFGAGTTKEVEPVDCQCVDFVKRELNITGPTKNAFEWDEVLLGKLEINQNRQQKFLSYTESLNPITNSLAVFDTSHQEVHPLYGHVGLVRAVKKEEGKIKSVLIEGGNHNLEDDKMYVKNTCSNVSLKWYKFNSSIKFFVPK